MPSILVIALIVSTLHYLAYYQCWHAWS